MYIKQLQTTDLVSIYRAHGHRYFPANELKPVFSIEKLIAQNAYAGYGLYQENTDVLAGFALLVLAPALNYALLDYYAILEEFQGTGLGGHFLDLLQNELAYLQGIYIEAENPQFSAANDEFSLENRRIRFYLRSGAERTGLLSQIFGVSYQILYLPEQNSGLSPERHYQHFDRIYKTMLPAEDYNSQVKIYRA